MRASRQSRRASRKSLKGRPSSAYASAMVSQTRPPLPAPGGGIPPMRSPLRVRAARTRLPTGTRSTWPAAQRPFSGRRGGFNVRASARCKAEALRRYPPPHELAAGKPIALLLELSRVFDARRDERRTVSIFEFDVVRGLLSPVTGRIRLALRSLTDSASRHAVEGGGRTSSPARICLATSSWDHTRESGVLPVGSTDQEPSRRSR